MLKIAEVLYVLHVRACMGCAIELFSRSGPAAGIPTGMESHRCVCVFACVCECACVYACVVKIQWRGLLFVCLCYVSYALFTCVSEGYLFTHSFFSCAQPFDLLRELTGRHTDAVMTLAESVKGKEVWSGSTSKDNSICIWKWSD